MTWVGKVIPA